MLITFEGPDCAGKTTQVNHLKNYIEKNYELEASIVHFPTHTQTSGFHVEEVLKNNVVHNPDYTILAYLTDFYNTIYGLNGTSEPKLLKDIRDPKKVVIFDRYYYSSLVMCKYWFGTDKINIKRFRENASQMINKLQLPVSDLNIVILPRLDTVLERLEAKNNKDAFENKEKTTQFYAAYTEAVTYDASDIFGSHGEVLPPVVINNTKCASVMGNFSDADCDIFFTEAKKRLTKTEEEISQEIFAIFESLIVMRNKIIFEEQIKMNSPESWISNQLINKIEHDTVLTDNVSDTKICSSGGCGKKERAIPDNVEVKRAITTIEDSDLGQVCDK